MINLFFSGGVEITTVGKNMDSVAEPIMVVTVIYQGVTDVFYQVCHHCKQICLLIELESKANSQHKIFIPQKRQKKGIKE